MELQKIIFLSSVKVNGERTEVPFKENNKPNPEDSYGITKLEAENLLVKYSAGSNLKYTIIRPPLIYGKNVPGNFNKLISLVQKGYFLPLKSVKNKRSLIGVNNLCDFIETSIRLPEADNEIFLVSDNCDISTPEMIEKIEFSLKKKSRLIPFPVIILKIILLLAGRRNYSRRIFDSLQVDISKAKSILNWNPPHAVEYDIKKAIDLSSETNPSPR